MVNEAYINIALQSIGGLISLMIIVFVKFTRWEHRRSDRLYIRLLLCNMTLMLSNVLSWYFDGRPGEGNHALIVSVNFCMYLLHYLLLGTATDYIVAFLEEWGIGANWVRRAMWGLVVFGCLMVFISQFNGMYYIIDANNVYQRGEWFLLFPIIGIIGVGFDILLLLGRFRKQRSKEYNTMVALLVLALLALGVQAVAYGAVYLYVTMTFVVICFYIFIQAEQSRKLSEQALELERSRTAIMLSQIQPHFLYNSLQGIQSLCDIDPPKASEALEHFSYYLRGNLDALSDMQLVSFEKELIHIKDYLYLEKMRFDEKLNIEWQLEYRDFLLPPLTVQPLIENAIRHGINKKERSGTLIIRSEQTAEGVVVTVQDDGVGFDPAALPKDERSHIGIENTRSRLKALCDGMLVIESVRGAGTTAKIILPQREAAT